MPGLYKKHTATQPVMPEMRLEPLNVCLNDVLHSHVHDINKSKIENECKMLIVVTCFIFH